MRSDTIKSGAKVERLMAEGEEGEVGVEVEQPVPRALPMRVLGEIGQGRTRIT